MDLPLPTLWAWAVASEVCEKIQDGTHFSPKKQLPTGPYPYVTAKNVKPYGLDRSNLAYLEEEEHRAIYERSDVKTGDVLLVKDGVNAGDAAINTFDGEISLLSSVCFLRPRSDALTATFLRYFLLSPQGYTALTGKMTGTAIRRIVLHRVRALRVPVAPLEEQRRVTSALDSYLSRLDDAVATLEQVQRNLKRYRASVLKAAVEGRLVPTEAKLARKEGRDYEPADVLLARILEERKARWIKQESEKGRCRAEAKTTKAGKPWTKADDQAALAKARAAAAKNYQEPVPPDTSELPELPEGWCWISLSALVLEGPQNGLYVPKSQYGEGTPILRIDDYQIGWSRPAAELQKVRIDEPIARTFGLTEGELVVNRVNSPSHLGKSLVVESRHVPAVFESNMMRMSISSFANPWFVHYYLSSVQGKSRLIRDAKWAVNQASINQGDVGRTPVPLAPLEEQGAIARELERLLSIASAAEETCALLWHRMQRLRQSILKWAFEGKLVDQDPDDEPASVLLERIKTDRETAQSAAKAKKTSGRAKRKKKSA